MTEVSAGGQERGLPVFIAAVTWYGLKGFREGLYRLPLCCTELEIEDVQVFTQMSGYAEPGTNDDGVYSRRVQDEPRRDMGDGGSMRSSYPVK